jgi:hypothetical protein
MHTIFNIYENDTSGHYPMYGKSANPGDSTNFKINNFNRNKPGLSSYVHHIKVDEITPTVLIIDEHEVLDFTNVTKETNYINLDSLFTLESFFVEPDTMKYIYKFYYTTD